MTPSSSHASRLALLLAVAALGTAATCSGADKSGDDSAVTDDSAASDDSSASDDSGAGAEGHLVINELVASNDAGISDEAEQFEDWLELHNPTDATIDLTGWSITDDHGVEDPWLFPEGTTVPPHGYLLIWCDEDEEDGPLHAAFKLSADGETATLLDPDGNIVDELSYPALETDVAYGRIPDASANLGVIDPPTPNVANPAAR